MTVLPRNLPDLVNFCTVHAPVWSANAAGIGLTPAEATAFQALADAAADALAARAAAEQAAKAATITLHGAVADARGSAATLVRKIKAYAEGTPKPDVIYNVAQIPPPATPSPLPPPGKPGAITVAVEPATGALALAWKASNPAGSTGVTYIIRRRASAQGSFNFVGTTGEKRFVDSTPLAGAATVEYTIQAQRANVLGPLSDIFVINFGASGGEGSGAGGLSIASAVTRRAA